jgi:hypothetical protein
LELLMEIARLKRSVASFGGAMLLAARRAEAQRRGLKEVWHATRVHPDTADYLGHR